MMFTHYSLGFVLLAVLISLACAVPLERRDTPESEYTVKPLNAYGQPVIITDDDVKTDIENSIFALAKKWTKTEITADLITHLHVEGAEIASASKSSMLYYELKGDVLHDRVCYGYLVTPPKTQNPLEITFSAQVILDAAFLYDTAHEAPPVGDVAHKAVPVVPVYNVSRCVLSNIHDEELLEISKGANNDTYKKFLERFTPIQRWVLAMAQIKGIPASDADSVTKAGNFLRHRMYKPYDLT
ncbi:hypothetical protein BDP27DRAFT_1502150 [Rhodocollybia butyracea]|uniref:Uncharacterized protein n=1 Tax=Rhodocollybia butyracea TaxID=206335 RepID=A0A9P5PWZ0_9AGAR|nr:hypothetical protein BDP27DRAFT_1502150 [Rhodocollybia butyracea]